MTKQHIIKRITEYLPHLGEDVLQSVLTLLENVQPDFDEWDRQIIADAEAGKLNSLIDEALKRHEAGESEDLFEGLEVRSKTEPSR